MTRLVTEMDFDHPMQHPFQLHGAGAVPSPGLDGVTKPDLVWWDTVLVRTGQTVDILFDVTNPGPVGRITTSPSTCRAA
jgi:FtsP/CotA-like multicopper oxidase with cupredoxin domain